MRRKQDERSRVGHPPFMSDGVTHLRIGGLRPRLLAEGPMSTFGVVQDQILATLLGLALTGLPVALNFLGQPVAVGVCLFLAALTAWRYEAAVPSVLLVGYLFQTTFVAYASAYVSDVSSLDAMKSYNFVTTAGIWFVLALRFVETYGVASPFVRRLII